MTRTMKRHVRPIVVIVALAVMASGCGRRPDGSFETPEAAVLGLLAAVEAGDDASIRMILGPEATEAIHSGDAVADKADIARVKALVAEKVAFQSADGGPTVALLGAEGWPLPIPLQQVEGRWRFDGPAGAVEMTNRRIGRNELSTLATLHAIVSAQQEYRSEGRDGNPPAYASRFVSQPGKRDGLFWPTAEGEPPSPLGPLVAEASADGYGNDAGEAVPYHGYSFALLTGQGEGAPGGARSYADATGLLTEGHAVVAWPAKYGVSGVMTFMTNQRGLVLQKDLGPDTETMAEAITSFDPDATWTPTGD